MELTLSMIHERRTRFDKLCQLEVNTLQLMNTAIVDTKFLINIVKQIDA